MRGQKAATIKDYQADSFFGVIWRWSYGFSSSPQDIWCFCPRCDSQLVYTEDRVPDRVWFTCEHCCVRLYESDGDKDYALSKIFRQIDRKIRNGEWKRVVVQTV